MIERSCTTLAKSKNHHLHVTCETAFLVCLPLITIPEFGGGQKFGYWQNVMVHIWPC